MAALTAAAAMATVSIEPDNRPRMTVSPYLRLMLLQRIGFKLNTLYAVPASGIRTSSLRKGKLFDAPSVQQPRQAKVSFDTARLVIDSVRLFVLPGELLLGRPWPRPHRGILNGDLVCERRWPGPRPALDQMQVLPRALKIGFRTEVRHVDHKHIAVPAATRVAVPLADAGRQMWTSVHNDVALPPLSLTNVVEDRDAARRLHDPAEAADPACKLRQPAGQAAVRWRTVLRPIMAIHACEVVTGRKFRKTRRGRRIILATVTRRLLIFTRLGRLQQGNAKFPFHSGNLLSRRRQRRKPAIWRIDNPRRARAGAPHGRERRVVGAGHVGLGPALRTPVPAEKGGSLSVQFGALGVGEKLLGSIPGGALEGRVGFIGPNALQIGFAPGRFQRRRLDGGGGSVIRDCQHRCRQR